jgi:hypothetical protein
MVCKLLLGFVKRRIGAGIEPNRGADSTPVNNARNPTDLENLMMYERFVKP